MNKIIIPTGYMGSGSSAITDLLSEYKNSSNKHLSYEYVFMHCPNGLFDLEDKLLIGNNAIRSDEAIRSFEEQMMKLFYKKYWWVANYKNIIGDDFFLITQQFIRELEQFNFPGYWYTHEEMTSKMFFKLCLQKLKKIFLRQNQSKKILKYNDGMRISFIKKDEYYKIARDYVKKILNVMCADNEDLIVDQLLLPFNLYRIDNYFYENVRAIVVQRDPRDVFIINKYAWTKKGIQVPIPTDVNQFCLYYKKMRESERKIDSEKVYRINFEDLIYFYEDSVSKLEQFLGFDEKHHINKFKRFNPDISINNTQVFRCDKFLSETSIIERELSQYLYEFPCIIKNDVTNSIEF